MRFQLFKCFRWPAHSSWKRCATLKFLCLWFLAGWISWQSSASADSAQNWSRVPGTKISLECIRCYSNFFVFSLGIYGSDVNNWAIDHRVLKMQHRWCIWPLWTISFIKCLTRKVLGGFFSLSSSSFFCQKSIFFYEIYWLNWLKLWFLNQTETVGCFISSSWQTYRFVYQFLNFLALQGQQIWEELNRAPNIANSDIKFDISKKTLTWIRPNSVFCEK